MPASTSFRTSCREPVLDEPGRPEEGGHDLGLRLARLDDEPLVRLVVLALVGGEEARADVAELGAEGERAREGGAVDDSAGADDRDVHGSANGRRQHEAVHGLVADVAGRLEARRDHGVHPLGLRGEGVLDVRDGVEVEHPRLAHGVVEPEHARMPAGGRQHLQLRAHLRVRRPLVEDRAHDVLGVGLLLRDPDVDRERLVGQRDGEADPVPHLLHDHRDLLRERVARDPGLLEDERRLGDRAERARLGDGGGEPGERDRPDPAHPRLHERILDPDPLGQRRSQCHGAPASSLCWATRS